MKDRPTTEQLDKAVEALRRAGPTMLEAAGNLKRALMGLSLNHKPVTASGTIDQHLQQLEDIRRSRPELHLRWDFHYDMERYHFIIRWWKPGSWSERFTNGYQKEPLLAVAEALKKFQDEQV